MVESIPTTEPAQSPPRQLLTKNEKFPFKSIELERWKSIFILVNAEHKKGNSCVAFIGCDFFHSSLLFTFSSHLFNPIRAPEVIGVIEWNINMFYANENVNGMFSEKRSRHVLHTGMSMESLMRARRKVYCSVEDGARKCLELCPCDCCPSGRKRNFSCFFLLHKGKFSFSHGHTHHHEIHAPGQEKVHYARSTWFSGTVGVVGHDRDGGCFHVGRLGRAWFLLLNCGWDVADRELCKSSSSKSRPQSHSRVCTWTRAEGDRLEAWILERDC